MVRPKKDTKLNTKIDSLTQGISNDVAKLAYQFYLDRGSQSGRELNDWLRAERIVKARRKLN